MDSKGSPVQLNWKLKQLVAWLTSTAEGLGVICGLYWGCIRLLCVWGRGYIRVILGLYYGLGYHPPFDGESNGHKENKMDNEMVTGVI